MTSNEKEKKIDCRKVFKKFPWELSDKALQTLNKQFYTYRAGHIDAVKLGRGAELQALQEYHQTKKIAIHEAGHIMAIWFGGSRNTASYATIYYTWSRYHEPHHHITPERKYPLETMAALFEEMCFCLSGRIAETMFFPEEKANFPYFIHWERSDIHKAINIAYYMVKMEWGLKIDPKNYECKRMTKEVLEDVSCYLIRGYEATLYLLKSKADVLLKVALELLKEITLPKDRLEALLGRPRKRWMSLYDRFCAFSMELRPLARKRYCLNKRKRSKKTKKRKANTSCSSKRKRSKALANPLKKKEERARKETQKKRQRTCDTSKKRKQSDSVAPKKRITNDGQIISVYS
ncbi:mitochondrial inner membrane m-AAA protease component AFG3L2-like [Parasteatoda tepidariorum]|uniref:mitochondrial inner membrane m-AAA protease component AFG3L2-like n=1 Tax=Parasteatoda tepidariorum TaxID=114398 RepID=UPI00077FD136|nr:AFG3-like protein 1 [Parasteatoda tepidariorum]